MVSQIAPAATTDRSTPIDLGEAPTQPPRRPRRTGTYVLRGIAIGYVGVLVLVPLGVVLGRTIQQGLGTFWDTVSDPTVVHAIVLTGVVAGIAVLLNVVFGIGMALLLARYRFPGRRLLNILIDLPLAVSPIVVGLALILVYGQEGGWLGGLGVQIIYSIPGMVLATVFVSLPLVVRALVPVLEEEGLDQELAARSLGANAQQCFRRITLPTIKWALAYGVVLSLARAIGEFGAVKVVSGNVIGQTQTVTLLVDERAEQFEPGAYQASILLIAVTVICIVGVSLIHPPEGQS
jgi:sulfate/thiosulfate transport system permease protein